MTLTACHTNSKLFSLQIYYYKSKAADFCEYVNTEVNYDAHKNCYFSSICLMKAICFVFRIILAHTTKILRKHDQYIKIFKNIYYRIHMKRKIIYFCGRHSIDLWRIIYFSPISVLYLSSVKILLTNSIINEASLIK